MPVDSNGDVDRAGTPLILVQHSDLRPLLKLHAMNHAIVHIDRPSGGQISFQPALVYTFNIDASHVQMPLNWQVDTGETVVHNFAHNCRDSVDIFYHFDNEKNNPSNDYKWLPDQLANTIQAFFTDGSYEVYCKQNGGTKRHPTLPASAPHPVVPRVKGGNASTAQHVVNIRLKEDSFQLDHTLQDPEV